MIVLSAGRLELYLLPDCGSIAAFRIRLGKLSHDLLRPASDKAVNERDPLGMGCFPLVPYSGPVSNGGFSFADHEYPLQRTHQAEPYPIHGDGWVNAWRAEQARHTEALLVYEHGGNDGFPFPYRARQQFQLDGESLRIEISVTNLSDGEMPAGLGLHPYFPKTPECELTTGNPLVWPDLGNFDATDPAPVPPEWDFSGGLSPNGLVLDHCFARWSRCATVRWPDRSMALELTAESPIDTAVIYIPEGEDYFCFEPVTNADDGFNRMGRGAPLHGVRVLKPGETLEGKIRFRPMPSLPVVE